MTSILGQKVTGHLGRPDTHFEGIVVEEYKVTEGAMAGSPMVKVELADGSHRYSFRYYVDVVTDVVKHPSGVTVFPSTFVGVYNLVSADGIGFGHVMNRLSHHGWTAWYWETSEDRYEGTFATRDLAIAALSVLAP
jgi:hypothetical protein